MAPAATYGTLGSVCGRFGSFTASGDLASLFDALDIPESEALAPSWNIAPGRDARVLIARPPATATPTVTPARPTSHTETLATPRHLPPATPTPPSHPHEAKASNAVCSKSRPQGGEAGADPSFTPVRSLRAARWGLLPPWASEPRLPYPTFNARSESAATKATFRGPMANFRALIPADCWYEWAAPGRPYAVRRRDGLPLTLAGLCSWWATPEIADAAAPASGVGSPDPGSSRLAGPAYHEHGGRGWLLTFTILTRPASSELAWLHERQPVIIGSDQWQNWLDPQQRDPHAAAELLALPNPALEWWQVDPRLGSTRSDGPHLLKPAASEGALF